MASAAEVCYLLIFAICVCVHVHLFSEEEKLLKQVKMIDTCYYFH